MFFPRRSLGPWLVAALMLAGCSDGASPPVAGSHAAALSSCNDVIDCPTPPGDCVGVACNNHVCETLAKVDCCAGDDTLCDDGNACRSHTCFSVIIAGGTADPATQYECHYAASSVALATCCTTGATCPVANNCQQSAQCKENSCTYVAKRTMATADATCCDSNADCSGGSTCNKATNRCVCAIGKVLCAGAAGTEKCNDECCSDSDCHLTNAEATCNNGKCEIKACTQGFGDCNVLPGDGCETNLVGNVDHCNACATMCTSAQKCKLAVCNVDTCGLVDNPACADMATPPDLAPAPDLLTPPVDAAVPPDLFTAADQAVVPDQTATPEDLASPPEDLAATSDDLTGPPDLASAADLVGADLVGVELGGSDLAGPTDLPRTDLVGPRDLGVDLAPRYSVTGGGCSTSEGGSVSFLGLLVLAGWFARRRQRDLRG